MIQEVHFIKLPFTLYLDESDKTKFNLSVDRSTTLNKVKGLLTQVYYFDATMRFGYWLKNLGFLARGLFNFQKAYVLLSFLAVPSG